MSRRNPMNERYGKHTAPGGKTRKSAASAKPKRTGATGSGSTPAKSSARSGAARPRVSIHPPTPEYRTLRRVWLALLITAIVLSVLAWILWSNERVAGTYVLAAGYAFIFSAIALDLWKMRPLRNAWIASQTGKSDKS